MRRRPTTLAYGPSIVHLRRGQWPARVGCGTKGLFGKTELNRSERHEGVCVWGFIFLFAFICHGGRPCGKASGVEEGGSDYFLWRFVDVVGGAGGTEGSGHEGICADCPRDAGGDSWR